MSLKLDEDHIKLIFKASIGEVLAMIISWSLHKSILWALIHGLFGWFYVVYYIFTRP